MGEPLSVAVTVVIHDGSILLMKRNRGAHVGYWALPGGKIEEDEHPRVAATRETREEAGIETEFGDHIGVVSEHLVENDEVIEHFLLHICELTADRANVTSSEEGEVRWFDVTELSEMRDRIVPSDCALVDILLSDERIGYRESVMDVTGDSPRLVRFE